MRQRMAYKVSIFIGTVGLIFLAAVTSAFANEWLSGTMADFGSQLQSDFLGAIVAVAPYVLRVGIVIGAVYLILHLAKDLFRTT